MALVFQHQMNHLEIRQKYSAAVRRIFNSLVTLLGVSPGDETLRLTF